MSKRTLPRTVLASISVRLCRWHESMVDRAEIVRRRSHYHRGRAERIGVRAAAPAFEFGAAPAMPAASTPVDDPKGLRESEIFALSRTERIASGSRRGLWSPDRIVDLSQCTPSTRLTSRTAVVDFECSLQTAAVEFAIGRTPRRWGRPGTPGVPIRSCHRRYGRGAHKCAHSVARWGGCCPQRPAIQRWLRERVKPIHSARSRVVLWTGGKGARKRSLADSNRYSVKSRMP